MNLLVWSHCPELLFYGGSQFPVDFVAPNIMTGQKGTGYQGIRAIEAFEYKNTRSDFKCCDYQEK